MCRGPVVAGVYQMRLAVFSHQSDESIIVREKHVEVQIKRQLHKERRENQRT